MNPAGELLQGGGAGVLLLAGLWARSKFPGRSVRASVVVSDEQLDATKQQTKAIDAQTKEARRVAERLGTVGGQLLGLTGAMADLRTEVHGLREDMSAMDRRVIRLETKHETNGSPVHGHD
jgi:phage shock protein A